MQIIFSVLTELVLMKLLKVVHLLQSVLTMKIKKEDDKTVFSSRIATVFRNEINDNLPISSTLGKKVPMLLVI